jgi:hypothetical protein
LARGEEINISRRPERRGGRTPSWIWVDARESGGQLFRG